MLIFDGFCSVVLFSTYVGLDEMTLARSEREWAILVSEYNVCKKKLNSKREALKILTSDLELCQRERDIYKTKIKQLLKEVEDCKQKEREQENKKVEKSNESTPVKKRGGSFSGHSVWEQELQNVRERKRKTLSQLLCESRGESKGLKKDLAELRQLYHDAQEDIQLLHEALAKQKNCNNSSKADNDGLDSRQDLISQLEKSQEKMMELERDKLAISDEKAEIAIERDHYKDKSERLNTQLNFILGGDDRRLVDIDSVLMENRYLKEQIKQLKEEKNMAVSALARYKNAFEKRKNKILQTQFPGSYSNTAKLAMPSLISDLVGHLGSGTPQSTVADLQFLANSLSETLSEKDIALQHLRSANNFALRQHFIEEAFQGEDATVKRHGSENRILGHRVAELEKKLKTLEVSGLWSLQGHRGYGSTEADQLYGKLEALIPEQERQANGNSKNHNPAEDAGRGSEPDSPSSLIWDRTPQSPTLGLSAFQDEVEEGVLVNVTGSPGDVLEELGCHELEDVDDNDNELGDLTEGHFCVQAHDCGEKADEQEEKSFIEGELARCKGDSYRDYESCEVSNGDHEDDSSHPSSPEIKERTEQTQEKQSRQSEVERVYNGSEDPDEKSVSDAELETLLKTIN